MHKGSVLKAASGVDIISNTSEWEEKITKELDGRLKNRRIVEVFLNQVSHPWYMFQTLLRLDDGTIMEVPFLSGALGPLTIDHMQPETIRYLIDHTTDEKLLAFYKRALSDI